MLGYLILGTTAMMAHSSAGLVEAPITYPRAPLYVPAAQMQTRELVERVVNVSKPHLLMGMMVYEGGSLGVTTYEVDGNPPGENTDEFRIVS